MSMLDGYAPGARAIAIAFRTAHLLAMAMLVGGVQLAAPDVSIRVWRAATVATGLALLVTEVRHSRHWLYQGRGVATLAHVAVLGLVAVEGLGRAALVAALVIGSVGSHLPRSVRKWSLRHREVVE